MKAVQTQGIGYRPDIDGLRAVAVLAVVVYHAFPGGLRGGFIGVDIFFVISGYLITSIVRQDIGQGTFTIGDFYRRRVRRIFPALILVLATVTAFGWWALLPQEYEQLGRHLAGAAGFVSNLVLWRESGYFDTVAETKLLLHLWSLAIEEQFYLVWPLLLVLIAARPRRWGLAAAAIGIVSLGLCVWLTPRDATAAFFAPYSRWWELMAGAALAHPALAWQRRSAVQQQLLSTLGAALVVAGLWALNPQRAFPGTWALLPVLGAALLIAAGPAAWLNRYLLSSRPAVAIGLISYPLYLWHWPLLAYAYVEEGAKPGTAIRASAALAALALAAATARWVERPLRHGRRDAPVLSIAAITLAITAAVGITIARLDGVPSRTPQASSLQSFRAPTLEPQLTQSCRDTYPQLAGLQMCFLSGNGEPEIAFVGDSHMLQYAATIRKHLGNRPYIILVNFACLPFSSRTLEEAPHCHAAVDLATRFLRRQTSIRHVVFAAHWGYLSSSGFESRRGSSWRLPLPLSDDRARRFSDSADRFLTDVSRPGRTFTALLDVPYLDFNINKCVAARPVNLVSRPVERCALERAQALERLEPYEAQLRRLVAQHPQLTLFDPKPLLCDERWCWAVRDQVPWYGDGDHLNAHGADQVLRRLWQQQGPRLELPTEPEPQTQG